MCTEPPQELAGAGTTSVAAAAATVVAVHGRTAVAVAVLLVGLPVVLETKRMGHKHHIRRFHRARAREQGGGWKALSPQSGKVGARFCGCSTFIQPLGPYISRSPGKRI